MKKIMMMLTAVVLVASCTETEVIDDANESILPEKIVLSSNIPGSIDVSTRGEGIIDSPLTSDLEISIVRLDQAGPIPAYPDNYSGITPLEATIGKDENNPITFDPAQYYLTNGNETKLMGWYPRGSWKIDTPAAPTVTIPIDGSTDILIAHPIEGDKDEKFSSMTFAHALTQVIVYARAENDDAITAWGQVTAIEFVDKAQNFVLTLPDPPYTDNITGAATGTGDLKMIGAEGTEAHSNITLTTTAGGVEVGYAMFAPSEEDEVLVINITTELGDERTVTLEDTELLAGNSYTLELVFNATGVESTARISSWVTTPSNGPIVVN